MKKIVLFINGVGMAWFFLSWLEVLICRPNISQHNMFTVIIKIAERMFI